MSDNRPGSPGTRVMVDRDRCIGTGQCHLIAPAAFAEGEDGFVVPLVDRIDLEQAGDVEEAAHSCPAQVIELIDQE